MESKKSEFLSKRVQEAKSLRQISDEMNIPVETLMAWSTELKSEIEKLKAVEYDKIIERYQLGNIKRLEYLGELYGRLKRELDKRDFTGLPTDKLYYILSDVREKIGIHSKSDLYEVLNELPGIKE